MKVICGSMIDALGDCVRDLGVQDDSTLRMDVYIYRIHAIRESMKYISNEATRIPRAMLLTSLLDYCNGLLVYLHLAVYAVQGGKQIHSYHPNHERAALAAYQI